MAYGIHVGFLKKMEGGVQTQFQERERERERNTLVVV